MTQNFALKGTISKGFSLNGKIKRSSLNGKINIIPDKTGGSNTDTDKNILSIGKAFMIFSGVKSDIVGIAETQEV